MVSVKMIMTSMKRLGMHTNGCLSEYETYTNMATPMIRSWVDVRNADITDLVSSYVQKKTLTIVKPAAKEVMTG